MKRMLIFPILLLMSLLLTLTVSAGDSYEIDSVKADGNTVTVSAMAPSECVLWCAVYAEKGQMIASQTADVTAPQTVPLTFADAIPEYGYAKAFLMDRETCRPLCTPGDTRNVPDKPESKVYAFLYTDGTMVFQHGNTPENGRSYYTPIYEVDMQGAYEWEGDAPNTPWFDKRTQIQRVEFADKIQPVSTQCWFTGCKQLQEIKNIQNLDTSKVVSMGQMFYACSGLTALDVSGFDTSNVVEMGGMFRECGSLTKLDVSGFKPPMSQT